MTQRLNIALDSDGCLYGFEAAYATFKGKPHPWATYDGYETHGISREEFVSDLSKYPEEIFGQEILLADPDDVRRLCREHNVTVVTARPDSARGVTERFLDDLMGGEPYKLIITYDKTLKFDVALDDHWKRLREFGNGGTPQLFLRSWHYNEGFEEDDFTLVSSFADFAGRL